MGMVAVLFAPIAAHEVVLGDEISADNEGIHGRLIGQQDLDCLFRVLIEQLVGAGSVFDRKTVSDKVRWLELADHFPRRVKTARLGSSTCKFWPYRTDLAADHTNTTAMEASAQVQGGTLAPVPGADNDATVETRCPQRLF